MFVYCLNNPVCRKDALGNNSVKNKDENDVDHTDDDQDIAGGNVGTGGFGGKVSSPSNPSNGSSGSAKANASGGNASNGGSNSSSGATTAGQGFDTYGEFKAEFCSAGEGQQWHHIVEQCQIEKSGFSPRQIQNTNNIIPVSKTTHQAISSYYSSVKPFTNGMTVRNWLAGQSFDFQYNFGIGVIQGCM